MKLINFNYCKMLLAVIIILLVVLTYYHNACNLFAKRVIGTESTQTLSHGNKNDVTASKRIKRFLIFQGGGVVKLVFGTSFPIMMADKKRSLNYFYNFQMQYAPPNIPLYWWSVFNTTTFAARTNLQKRSMDKLMYNDKSRTLIYEIIETILQRSGYDADDCLLKIICEVARTPFDEDFTQLNTNDNEGNDMIDDYGRNIYHKVINAIFLPQSPNVDERYLNARIAGQNGADCDATFRTCDIAERLFKRFTQFI